MTRSKKKHASVSKYMFKHNTFVLDKKKVIGGAKMEPVHSALLWWTFFSGPLSRDESFHVKLFGEAGLHMRHPSLVTDLSCQGGNTINNLLFCLKLNIYQMWHRWQHMRG